MRMAAIEPLTEHLTDAQAETFRIFRERLNRRSPKCRIRAVEPLQDNAIRVWLDDVDLTYHRVRTACKLAVEVEEETGIFIVLR